MHSEPFNAYLICTLRDGVKSDRKALKLGLKSQGDVLSVMIARGNPPPLAARPRWCHIDYAGLKQPLFGTRRLSVTRLRGRGKVTLKAPCPVRAEALSHFAGNTVPPGASPFRDFLAHFIHIYPTVFIQARHVLLTTHTQVPFQRCLPVVC